MYQYLVATVIPFHNKPLQQPIDRQPPALSETVRRDALKISKFLVFDI